MFERNFYRRPSTVSSVLLAKKCNTVYTYEDFFVGVKVVVWLAISDDLIYIDIHTTVVGPISKVY